MATRHQFTGLLANDKAELRLRMADGRSWRLSVPVGIERYIGHRVRITGTLGDCDLFHVDQIERAG